MFKVSVMYPNKEEARFDHTYYRDKHMPLVKDRLGEACKFYTVDKGLAGGAPGAPATYVGMCHFFVDSIEAYQAGMGKHGKEIRGDLPERLSRQHAVASPMGKEHRHGSRIHHPQIAEAGRVGHPAGSGL